MGFHSEHPGSITTPSHSRHIQTLYRIFHLDTSIIYKPYLEVVFGCAHWCDVSLTWRCALIHCNNTLGNDKTHDKISPFMTFTFWRNKSFIWWFHFLNKLYVLQIPINQLRSNYAYLQVSKLIAHWNTSELCPALNNNCKILRGYPNLNSYIHLQDAKDFWWWILAIILNVSSFRPEEKLMCFLCSFGSI